MDNEVFHRQREVIRSFEVGPDGKVRIPQLINYMQDAAWNHTINMEVSIHDLQQKGLTWVLSRKKVEILRRPGHLEELTVETWPSGSEKFFFYRDFRIMDQSEQLVSRATSTWLIFDMNSRKMVPVPDFLQSIPSNKSREAMPVAREKLKPPQKEDLERVISVSSQDLDINRHTNNAKYFGWIMDSIQSMENKSIQPSVMDFQFRAESFSSDSLRIVTEKVGNLQFIHQIINEKTHENVVLAQSEWLEV